MMPSAEQCIELAREAGLYLHPEHPIFCSQRDIKRFAALAHAAGYREGLEAAAEIAEGHFIHGHSVAGPGFAKVCADRIRAAKGA